MYLTPLTINSATNPNTALIDLNTDIKKLITRAIRDSKAKKIEYEITITLTKKEK